jgi:hypothetical protein
MFKYYRTIPYERRSKDIDKWGEVAHEPTREITFVDDITGEIFTTTDLKIKLHRRNKKITEFYNFYYPHFKEQTVSAVLYVVNVEQISSMSNQLKTIRKRLNKKQIKLLAYYWQRDNGKIKFIPHYHVLLILPRISVELFKVLFKAKNKSNSKAVLCKNLKGFTKYLNKKEFFAPYKKRNNSMSRKMLIPPIILN